MSPTTTANYITEAPSLDAVIGHGRIASALAGLATIDIADDLTEAMIDAHVAAGDWNPAAVDPEAVALGVLIDLYARVTEASIAQPEDDDLFAECVEVDGVLATLALTGTVTAAAATR